MSLGDDNDIDAFIADIDFDVLLKVGVQLLHLSRDYLISKNK
jgi:hypothetical protein